MATNLELNSSNEISEADDTDDEVVFQPTDYFSSSKDVPPLDFERKRNGSKYKAALSQLQPVRPSNGNEASRIDQAGCLSFITYGWIFSYLWSTYRGLIPADQQWTCSTYDSASVNVSRLEYLWRVAQTTAARDKSPSFIKTVWKFMQTRILVACLIFMFCLLFGFIGPSCLVRSLILYAETSNLENKTLSQGLIIVFGLTAVELLRVLTYGATWAISYRTAIRVRCAVLGMLYKKLLVARGLSSKGVGNIVNTFSNDGQRIFDAVTFVPLVLMGPLVLIGGMIYLLWLIGPWSLLGLLVFIVFDVIQVALGKTMVRYRKLAIEKSNERIKLITEIVQCIKTIKMNAWEYPFIDKVCEVRKVEKKNLQKAGYAQSLAIAAGPVVPVVAAAITFSAYLLSGNKLEASAAFTAVTVFFVMVFGIRMIPYGMRYCAEASVSLRTIQSYLLLPEVDTTQLPTHDRTVAIDAKNATFTWDSETASVEKKKSKASKVELRLLSEDISETSHILKDITFKLKKKQLIGICGPVGCGKSSLLYAVSGEMLQKSGNVLIGGSIITVSQDPWIVNTTFRENVLFGETFEHQKYYKVIYACSLNPDINTMPAGDHTEISERGATLSGGQKSRLALARALYSNRDIYLLDDFLVSLDAQVSQHIFDSAIRGLLVDKSVMLVTNNVQYLAKCDEVIYMKAGKIVDIGRHEEMSLRCDDYVSFCEASSKKFSSIGTPIENVFLNGSTTEHGKVTNGVLLRSPSEIELVQKKEEARLRSVSHLSTAESVYDIPTAVGMIMEPEEDFGLASVSFSVYKTYIFSLGGYLMLLFILLAFLFNVGATLFSTVWLAVWLKSLRHGASNLTLTNVSTNLTEVIVTNDSNMTYYASWYFGSIALLIITSIIKAILFVYASLKASNKLHNDTFYKVIHATMRWFDTTPLGRIVNRFSKDVDELDVKIPFCAETFVQNIFQIAGYLLVIAWVFPWFLIACLPLGVLFFVFVACFRSGIRCLKRTENNSRSPMFSHIECSLQGAVTIRSFGRVKYFTEKFKHLLDNNSGCMFMYNSAMRWLAVWLDMLVVLVTFVTALLIVLLSNSVEPAYAGMAVAFAIQMSGIFQFAVRMHAELESKLTSVERLDFYIKNTEQDPEWYNPRSAVPFDWPQDGRVSFRDLQLKYRDNLNFALKGISFEAKPNEKVGIIGRTGSGKSSIGAALFRLYPLSNGSICIDGQDVTTIGLHELRLKMSAIPQDPTLFAGTVRFNLDPSRKYDDSKLWEALENTRLKTTIAGLDKGLDAEIFEGGKNFSVGQRQLLCLARALLRNVKILLLDEATATLDDMTDNVVRECVYQQFKNCTLLIIAHRISSATHTDKTLFMESGKIVEFDETDVLIQNQNSHLRKAFEVALKDSSNLQD